MTTSTRFPSAKISAVVSDVDGTFQFDDLADGKWTIASIADTGRKDCAAK